VEFQEDQKGILWLLKKKKKPNKKNTHKHNTTQNLILIVKSFNSVRGNSKG